MSRKPEILERLGCKAELVSLAKDANLRIEIHDRGIPDAAQGGLLFPASLAQLTARYAGARIFDAPKYDKALEHFLGRR